jgi:hypothetical protein
VTLASWTDHACRACGARLLERREESGRTLFECGSCGAKANGVPVSICGCGILPKPVLAGQTGPRFRCAPNPSPSASNLSVIVIAFDEDHP